MLSDVTALIGDELEVVERNLSQHLLFLKLDERVLQPAPATLRLRAAMHILSANLCGYTGASAVQVATILELMHLASGVHHIVVEHDVNGNGNGVLNHDRNNWIDILRGDWLWMQAFRLATSERNFRILEILTAAAKNIVEGEMLQLCASEHRPVGGRPRLGASARKTAHLTGACMQLGGVLAGKKAADQKKLFLCGFYLGLAWIVANEPVEAELLEMESARASCLSSKQCLTQVASREAIQTLLPRKISLQVDALGASRSSHEVARAIGLRGFQYLESYPESPFRRSLHNISMHLCSRGS
jgi:hypothetical protein